MSFIHFGGDFVPSKVEVAITEPNRHIALIFLMFQNTICQLVSDLDQLTALALYIPNSLFNRLTVLSDTSDSFATFLIG